MAKLALAVIRMTGDVMCGLVVMLVTTATFIVLMLFMLMTTAAFIILVLMVMMLVATAAFIVIVLFMIVVRLLGCMVIATAAIIVVFMLMLVSMGTTITMAMLRNMPHAAMIVVLATVTTGTAFGMVAIIFIPLNMSVHMSKAAHLFRGVTHFF